MKGRGHRHPAVTIATVTLRPSSLPPIVIISTPRRRAFLGLLVAMVVILAFSGFLWASFALLHDSDFIICSLLSHLFGRS